MKNKLLTPHFSLLEFTESATARKHGIANDPPPKAVENLRRLCTHTLEPLRVALNLPVIITSGYRCQALNDIITHHSHKSQHLHGQAADFYVGVQGPKFKVQSGTHRQLLIKAFRTIITDEAIDFDQLIIYPTFIHVSYVGSGKNRHKIMSGSDNGRYCALTREQALGLV